MISSTSWTPDEDFNMLFNSFVKIEENLKKEINIKKVLFIITGRGPQKEYYMNKVSEMNFKYFIVKSIWLESDDYPKILGSSDLGICLHYSSSGFDLPMKVVDMFSAQLPVCAVYYPTITELVEEKKNGYLFKDEDELAVLLEGIIKEYSRDNQHLELNKFSENLEEFGRYDWVTQWRDKAADEIVRILGIENIEKKIN